MMNTHAFQRAGVLVVALAFMLSSTAVVQADLDELFFDLPVGAALDRSANSFKKATTAGSPTKATPQSTAGKATIGSTGTSAPTAQRKPIPGTEPKAYISRSQPVAPVTPTLRSVDATSGSQIKPAGHVEVAPGPTRDGVDPALVEKRSLRHPIQPQQIMMPPTGGGRPGLRGLRTGLNGETATERLIQVEALKSEVDRENDELRQQFTLLQARYKESQEQLMTAAREIQAARKELSMARNDLDRLRGETQNLRERIRLAEKEHAGFIQSMAPLLQQILESTDVSALPPNPTE